VHVVPSVASTRSPVARALFLRLLALVYLVAFVSLWTQIDGLVGSQGLLPLRPYLERLSDQGVARFWQLPTLCWLSASDAMLHALCLAGSILALLLACGVAPIPVLAGLWATYLSLVVAGQSFLSFQWDTLLLEAGFSALFFAPGTLWPRWPQDDPAPSRSGLWLSRSLLFKLMFLSGTVKLLCLDPTWWGLTALDYHYYTQPLPTWTSWYAQHWPAWFQRLSVAVVYVIEIGVPFLIFCGRRARLFAFGALVFLQLMIAGTGNYGFFNLLTLVLCVPLLDDGHLAAVTPRGLRSKLFGSVEREPRPSLRWLRVTAVALVLGLSGLSLVHEMARTVPRDRVSGPGRAILEAADRWVLGWGTAPLAWIAPLRTVNGYGLFRAMTTARPEIALEGSLDGQSWREIAFRYKAGDVTRRPRFVAPHQPRLDWQMWFAALNPRRQEPWLRGLTLGLLQGTPAVLDLLGPSPFADEPPRYVRWVMWRYEFTTAEERRRSGAWWKRDRVGELTAPLSLETLGAQPRRRSTTQPPGVGP
jgi:lipase maturation factor 1